MNDPVCACVNANRENMADVMFAAASPCGRRVNITGSVFPATAEPAHYQHSALGSCVEFHKCVLSELNPFHSELSTHLSPF